MTRSFAAALALCATGLLFGCPDQNISAVNAHPAATVTSHADGDALLEGTAVTFHGIVSDPDHQAVELLAAWRLGGDEICSSTVPSTDGMTSCEALIDAGDTSLTLEVVDPLGAAGAAVLTMVVTPTDAPEASIISPESSGTYYSDQLIVFEGLVSDAEDASDLLTAWWESSLEGELPVDADPDSDGEVLGTGYLDQGEHAVSLHTQDSSGKSGSDSVVITVGPPNTAPSCEITAPNSGGAGEEGALVTFEALVSDEDVSADWLSVVWSSDWDGELGTSTPSSAGDVGFSTSDLSVATHSITLTVSDEMGSTCSDFIYYTVGTPPEVTLTSPASGSVYNEDEAITFSADVSDNEDSPTALSLSWDSDLDGTISTQGADSSGVAQFTIGTLSAGDHSLTVTVTDSDGLYSTSMVGFNVNTLPTAPTVSISPDPATTGAALVATASGSTDPDGSGTVTYSHAWYESGALSSASTSASFPSSATTKGLTYTVVVTPSDGTGDGEPGEAEVTIDNSVPVIATPTISPSSGVTTSETLTCAATATDRDGDTPIVSYAWTSGASSLGTGASLTLTSSTASPGDTINCTATATDDEGATDSGSASVTVDNSAPTVDSVSISPASGVTTSTGLTCSATASDLDGGSPTLSYAWSNGGTSLGTGASVTLSSSSSAPGDSITCSATATDSDGGTGSDNTSVVVENSDPVVHSIAISPSSGVTTSETLTCSASASDADGGSPTLSYGWSNGSTSLGTGSTLTLTPTTSSSGDSIACTATATDTDGGTGSDAASVTVVNSAPSIVSVSIRPDPAFAADTLSCSYSGYSDPDGDADASSYAWTVNGSSVDSGSSLSGAFVGGDGVACTVTPHDGIDPGAPIADSLGVSNTPPLLDDVTLTPSPAYEGDTLTCTPGSYSDDDGESATFAYTWVVAGVDPGITGSTLSSAYFDRDEAVVCSVTPNDGTDDGGLVGSNSVTISNSVPSITSVTVSPSSPSTTDTLTCSYGGYSDADGDPDASTYAWTVDGAAAGSGSTLGATLSSGDVIICTVTPHDGTNVGTALSDSVTVANAPPVVDSVTLSPTSAYTDDTITTSVSTRDDDGDSVSLSYAWYVGGSLVGGTGSTLDGATWFDKDQEVYVIVTPNDGTGDGTAAASSSVTILNTPPEAPTVSIVPDEPTEGVDDLICMIDTESIDADGDSFTYTFTWTADGSTWTGSTSTTYEAGDTIAGTDTSAEDEWSCTVTPNDGDGDGSSEEASVTVITGLVGIEIDLSAADVKLIGEAASDHAGYSVSSAGDVDADGFSDLLVGAYDESTGGFTAGAAYLVLGPVSGDMDLSLADAKLIGETASDWAGWSVSSAGDVNADGHDDLLVGAPYEDGGGSNAGAAYLVLGPVSGEMDFSLADAKLIGEAASNFTGHGVSSAGDVNADGFADLLVGAYGEDSGGTWAGAAYLVLGPVSGEVDLSAADAKLIGEAASDFAGISVSSAGDMDADGHDDLLIGAYGDSGGTYAGAAYLVLGPVSGEVDLSAADAKLIGEAASDYAGISISSAGDVDADGHDDLLVGAYREGSGGAYAGAAYLVLGPVSGEVDLSGADAKLVGAAAYGQAGYSVSSAGDVDADGHDDLLVGAHREGSGGTYAGAAYLVMGPVSGTQDLSIADVKLIGEAASDRAGISVSSAGDVDADGFSDLLIGAHGEDSGGSEAGAAYLVFGADL